MGVHLFMACGIAKIKFSEIVKEMVPFLIMCLIVILLTTFVPQVSLFLTQFV